MSLSVAAAVVDHAFVWPCWLAGRRSPAASTHRLGAWCARRGMRRALHGLARQRANGALGNCVRRRHRDATDWPSIKDVNPNAPAASYRAGQFGINNCSPVRSRSIGWHRCVLSPSTNSAPNEQCADIAQAPPAPQTPNSAASKCQTAWIGGAERFCLFVRRGARALSSRVQLPDAALTGNGQATIAGANSNAVAYCVRQHVRPEHPDASDDGRCRR